MTAGRRDEELMRRCLELARRGEGRTAPDPMVGCVVADRRGRAVAEAWQGKGDGSCEARALERAGPRAAGGTLYTSIEPPRDACAAVSGSGVARAVIGMARPIARGGAAWLRRRGIDVSLGILADECAEANRAFAVWAREGRPWFTLKAAATLDGKVATWRGESKWVTGEAARAEGHRWRDAHDAILVGVGTVLADDPSLTVRGVAGGRDPVRVVIDSRLRVPDGAALLRARGTARRGARARVIVAAARRAPSARERRLRAAGAEVWRLPSGAGRVDLGELARRLAAEGVASVLVEGGPTVHASMLEAGLVDEVRLVLAPMVLGGAGRRAAPGWAGGAGGDRLADAWRMRFAGEPRRLGEDLLLVLRPR
ncbi:MAG TPA: bifunctional diaminohydroxyphosphoribosylaminopyrimidine deaminase/5-amino-6-(5-phosphoribosylamino)uracil reductase RibD [Kofleriaceae bacterium]|nr:bifunctional diaminohydroxyphosphoribosylaminopyrimidine deaminase/5-amino-6-(5-phosphoribosylamino)uracil reductase RibD [Kofleriaceae bacterium]